MAALSIRGLDEEVAARLRVRAAQHGRSMEAEIRAILTEVAGRPSGELFTAMLDRFAAVGGVDLAVPDRTVRPRAADLAP